MINGADTAWLMMSSILVLMMTLPALGFFYGGLVQAKNILSVLFQCAAIAALVSLLWFAFVYSEVFSGSNPWIGDLNDIFLAQVTRGAVHPGTHIPETVFVMFQMTFAIITPGADRRRLCRAHPHRRGVAVLGPVAGAGLCAGGALGVGRRISRRAGRDGFRRRHRRPSDGRTFGHRRRLDAGAAPRLSALSPSAACAVDGDGRRLAVVGRLVRLQCRQRAQGGRRCRHDDAGHPSCRRHRDRVWVAIEWIKFGKPSLVGAVTGMVAGLATITPASGFVGPLGAVALGSPAARLLHRGADRQTRFQGGRCARRAGRSWRRRRAWDACCCLCHAGRRGWRKL